MMSHLPDDMPIIVMTKDPVRFNASLYQFWRTRRPHLDRGKNLSEFLQKPLVVYEHTKDRMNPEYLFASPTCYWNQYHYTWLHWKEVAPMLTFVQIENLMKDPHNELTNLANKFKLTRSTDETIVLPLQAIAPSQDGVPTKVTKLETTSRERMSEVDIITVRNLVNSAVANALGYDTY
jgi:hypothetical protein